jgi:hypothetical protein
MIGRRRLAQSRMSLRVQVVLEQRIPSPNPVACS